mgnify:FL=1
MNSCSRTLAAYGALALLLAGLGAAALFATQSRLDRLQQQRQQMAAELMHAEQRLQSLRREAGEIDLRVAKYRALAARGIHAEENRLDWVEALNGAALAAGAENLRYSFAARRQWDRTGEVLAHASLVTLDAQVLHEERFLRFLRAVAAEMKPYVSIRACSLARADSRRPDAGLRTRCTLALITLTDPHAGKPTP